MKVSVIMSTYNSPDWLEKVLWGYAVQTYKDFEILIADDGSGEETLKRIDHMRNITNLDIRHVWHEHQGYRRQTILNKAIVEASTDYIIFTDGDCIPRKDFVSVHVAHIEKGRFLSGGYCKLPMDVSKMISQNDILRQQCFDFKWLYKNGLRGASQKRKLMATRRWGRFLDFITPATATFNNCNSSAWKEDLIAVNGYDERMRYGGPDREIGERLENFGVKGKQIRHQAIVVHLDHARGYKTQDSIEKNLAIRREVRKKKITWTPYGIAEGNPSE